jgi:transposase
VVIDPHAGYAAAIRVALSDAQLAVDHFHLIMLANKAVTAVGQRVSRELLGRRGRKIDPAWANRRLLLRGRERLSPAALARMWHGCGTDVSTTTSAGRSCLPGSRKRSSAGHQQADQQVKRAACGFTNRDNYRRRVRLHCTRQTRRLSARIPTMSA